MQGGLVLVDRGETPDRFAEDIVGQIVIDRRDFANQDITALAPESMPVARQQGDALTRLQLQQAASLLADDTPISSHLDIGLLIDAAIGIGIEQLEDERAAAAIDDVFRLDDMAVHR